MGRQLDHSYEFGPFRLDTSERFVMRNGEMLPVTGKAFDTLLVLVENSGHVVERNELIQKVWPDTFVEEGNLSVTVSMLRKALGDSSSEPQYIATVAGRGYRFIAGVRQVLDESGDLILERHTKSHLVIEEEEDICDREVLLRGRPITESPEFVPVAEPLTPATTAIVSGTAAVTRPRRLGRLLTVGAAALALSAALAIWLYKSLTRQVIPFQAIKIAKLTHTGRARDAVISPDGKYVAYVEDAERQSIWIRQVGTDSNVQVVPPADVSYRGLSFSPDGRYFYYISDDKRNPTVLYQVPMLGGLSRKVIAHVDSPVTSSPDGKRLAFLRRYLSEAASALMVTNADGTGEQKLVSRPQPHFLYGSPAWSPDGKVIACAAARSEAEGRFVTIIEVRVDDGSEKPITSHEWQWVRDVAWLSDGHGLIINALTRQPNLMGNTRNFQIWHVAYPGGQTRKITNDSNEYMGLSVTSDSSSIVTVQMNALQTLWVMPNGETSLAKQIVPGASEYPGLSWTPDGRIVYSSIASGDANIWIMNADGSDQKQLTADSYRNAGPSATSDGRYIIFDSARAGARNIWRMDIDGGNPKQLTNGPGEWGARCSPDGKWVLYQTSSLPKRTLSMVSIDGGDPVQITDIDSLNPAFSPDGKSIAFHYKQRESPTSGIAVVSSKGGRIIQRLDIPPTAHLSTGWTPDGQAVAYIDNRNGVSNIWCQSLDGSPPKQLTDFKSDRIFRFDWSRDGKQLACTRAVITTDIVLIRSRIE